MDQHIGKRAVQSGYKVPTTLVPTTPLKDNTVCYLEKTRGQQSKFLVHSFVLNKSFNYISKEYCFSISNILNAMFEKQLHIPSLLRETLVVGTFERLFFCLYTKPESKISKKVICWGIENGIVTSEQIQKSIPSVYFNVGNVDFDLGVSIKKYSTQNSKPVKYTKEAIASPAKVILAGSIAIESLIKLLTEDDSQTTSDFWDLLVKYTELEPVDLRSELLGVTRKIGVVS